MIKYIKVLILFILIFPMLLCAQKTDTINNQKNSNLPNKLVIDSTSDAKLTDTIKPISTVKNEEIVTPDILYLTNGDKLSGKLISFEQGRMRFDAQGPGIIYVKWYKIKSIGCGSKLYRVESTSGEIFKGRIIDSPVSGEITVLSIPKQDLKFQNISRIYALESEWYKGFKGDLGGGVSYTKSSDVLRINAESNLYYVIPRWRFINAFSYISTSTADSEFSERIQFSLEAFYALRKKWFVYEQNSFNRNDELGIDAKISFGAGAGNNLVLTEIQKLQIFTGILQNFEKNIQIDEFNSNVEWQATLQHTFYSFLKPNLTASTALSSFVGITETSRYRFDATTDLTWEFVTNFKLQFSFYFNYDNKKIQGKNSETDYGPILSFLLDLK
ncbi:DUF481 domain-containing protein [Flavobacterium sp. RSB2_4_14]|uniref:DUF481 domain-containing protein n=1 Tax=Flavobacterium sp. RSB2_4_14 TaxID=3447665 RepID=UPI003F30901C